MAHVAPWKRERVKELTELLTGHPVLGVISIHGIPSPQMQRMRQNLRSNATFTVSKNKLMLLAIEQAKKEVPKIEALVPYIQGQCGLLFSDINPFQLYKKLEATKTEAPAKSGDISPEDIVIEPGETSFKPGPIVGELQRIGIRAAIERGKVVIKKKSKLVTKGEEINAQKASMLSRMEIYPMEIGLDLISLFEDGTVFEPDDLDIDEEKYIDQLRGAVQNALHIALHIGYVTPITIRPLIGKAYTHALALATAGGIATPETISHLLSTAHQQMLALANEMPEACDDELQDLLAGVAIAAPAASPATGAEGAEEEAEEEEEDEEEEEASEEDGFAGLGSLFG